MTKRKSRPYEVHIRLGDNLRSRLATVCVLRREATQSAYIRRAIELQIDRDMEQYPGHALAARPGSMVYSMTGVVKSKGYMFAPLTKTLGGERVWIISAVGSLPRVLGGGYAYLVDITAGASSGGMDHRGVVLASEDIIGTTNKRR